MWQGPCPLPQIPSPWGQEGSSRLPARGKKTGYEPAPAAGTAWGGGFTPGGGGSPIFSRLLVLVVRQRTVLSSSSSSSSSGFGRWQGSARKYWRCSRVSARLLRT